MFHTNGHDSLSFWQLLYHFGREHAVFLVLATWVSTAIGAAAAYCQQRPDGVHHWRAEDWKIWLRFCLPRAIFQHPSCRLDLGYLVVRTITHPFILTPLLIAHLTVATIVYRELTVLSGPRAEAGASMAVWLGIVALCVVVHDCINFHLHYLEHRVRVLWEAHKVHHSTEFLLPISNRRIHMIQEVMDTGLSSVGVGAVLGGVSYALGLRLQDNLLLGIDAYFVINALSFYHLRHSHIRLSYGWLERVLLSPSQHQIHHASDEHLWDRNFGLLLSFWDRMYGTIVYSRDAPVFRLGLPPGHEGEYDRVWKLFLTPFHNIGRIAWNALPVRTAGAARQGFGAMQELDELSTYAGEG